MCREKNYNIIESQGRATIKAWTKGVTFEDKAQQQLAKKEMQRHQIILPDADLAYLSEGSDYFNDYVEAVEWAQDYALKNREIMMHNAIAALKATLGREFETADLAVNCHHNYVSREHHFGKDCFVTRKGAVSAKKGEMGIIHGSTLIYCPWAG